MKPLDKWAILLFDIMITLLGAFLSMLLRDNLVITTNLSVNEYVRSLLVIVLVRLVFFVLFKSYHSMIRFTSTHDIQQLTLATFSASIFLILLNFISFQISHRHVVPVSVVIMEFFVTTLMLLFYRFSVKIFYMEAVNVSKVKKRIIIFGTGETGISTKRALDRETSTKYDIVAFVDEDIKKIGKKIENTIILDYNKLDVFLSKNDISFLIIAIQNLSAVQTANITDLALKYKVKVLRVPPVMRWINGELSFKQIKKVRIEDLMGRPSIVLDESLIRHELRGKTVMITGAAGSIGSEIVRQLLRFNYKHLVLIDQAETPVFYLSNECYNINGLKNISIDVVNILDEQKMEQLMTVYQPDLIYHAAAYKHVPVMEDNTNAALKINVLGTKLLADMAVKHGVSKFVMVSTDKAVNPTTIMGATKRIAEIYVQSLNAHQNTTRFITTRFGNVLGSNGSVIPLFKKQIEEGGPVTVTHPEVTRYFMTIPEACQLVINAGFMGKGGEIFIFDMGESVKIYDLAKKMIQLSGLILGKDIQIKFTGLRPGEKLYEELLADHENTLPTTHDKIMIARVRSYSYEKINEEIKELEKIQNEDATKIVKKFKEVVPEFNSLNDNYMNLD
ncbi:MAG: polysaccharide biosynthesis protein [Bacteroidales bacterium]|nr:polysaccharide biosynthesis protein [Bacteroidales bacterium]